MKRPKAKLQLNLLLPPSIRHFNHIQTLSSSILQLFVVMCANKQRDGSSLTQQFPRKDVTPIHASGLRYTDFDILNKTELVTRKIAEPIFLTAEKHLAKQKIAEPIFLKLFTEQSSSGKRMNWLINTQPKFLLENVTLHLFIYLCIHLSQSQKYAEVDKNIKL